MGVLRNVKLSNVSCALAPGKRGKRYVDIPIQAKLFWGVKYRHVGGIDYIANELSESYVTF